MASFKLVLPKIVVILRITLIVYSANVDNKVRFSIFRKKYVSTMKSTLRTE
jgi:hypothetical protein